MKVKGKFISKKREFSRRRKELGEENGRIRLIYNMYEIVEE